MNGDSVTTRIVAAEAGAANASDATVAARAPRIAPTVISL
jgi:hypothetical protein